MNESYEGEVKHANEQYSKQQQGHTRSGQAFSF